MPPNELVVVHECDPKPSDLHLIKLAAFMGVPVRGGEREHFASMPQPVIVARYASKYEGRAGDEALHLRISSGRK